MMLADLIAQLEAAKFLRLYRHLTDSDDYALPNDEFHLPSEPVPVDGEELLLKKFGHVGSTSTRIMSWLFQIVHLPAGLWTATGLDSIMQDRLAHAFAGLAALPNPARYFEVVSENHRTPEWSSDDRAYYYVLTNVMHDTAEPALERLVKGAHQQFAAALPDIVRPRFGLGTPATMEAKALDATEDFIKALLREPSGLQLIARDGRISVSAFSEHGEYAAAGAAAVGLATATHSLPWLTSVHGAMLSELEDLINRTSTKEADLQRFFSENPDFLRTSSRRFGEVRPHLGLVDPSGNRLVPDFMARIEDQSVWEAVELKLPQHPVIVSSPSGPAPSAAAARAVSQLISYRDHFASQDNRRKVAAAYGISPFEPALVVVIGRDREARRFRWGSRWPGFPSVDLVSYDFLLERAREWVSQLER